MFFLALLTSLDELSALVPALAYPSRDSNARCVINTYAITTITFKEDPFFTELRTRNS